MLTSTKEKILKAFEETGGDPSDESGCLAWLSLLPFDNPDLHKELLGDNYASIDDKLDKLSQHHCRACPEFCVNGQMAGNCRPVWRHNELTEACSP